MARSSDSLESSQTKFTVWFWLSMLAIAIFQVAVIHFNPLDLSADEAHYWEWSKRLDYSYYSKGPLVAYAIYASTLIFGDTELGVRFPAVFCELLFSAIFFYHLRESLGARKALLILLLLRSCVAFVSMGFAITTDPLLIVFWLLALIWGGRAIETKSPAHWIGFGLSAGLAMLAKYTAVILPVGMALMLILHPKARKNFFSPGPYLGGLAFLIPTLPVLYWNYLNGWVNFSHNKTHLSSSKAFSIQPAFLIELLASQLGFFGPLFFPILVLTVVLVIQRRYFESQSALFYASVASMLLICCSAVSLTKRVYANWPIPFSITAALLFAETKFREESFLNQKFLIFPSVASLLKWSAKLNIFLLLAVHLVLFGVTFGIPGKNLTTKKLVGWSELAQRVGEIRNKQGGELEVAAESYDLSSTLAFYLKIPGRVLCGVFTDRRMNQYDLWGGWEKNIGKDFIIVTKESTGRERLEPYFRNVRATDEVAINYAGSQIQRFNIFLAEGYNGKEFSIPSGR